MVSGTASGERETSRLSQSWLKALARLSVCSRAAMRLGMSSAKSARLARSRMRMARFLSLETGMESLLSADAVELPPLGAQGEVADPKGLTEGIRTTDPRESYGNRRCRTTPQSRLARQLPFTGEPLVRCVLRAADSRPYSHAFGFFRRGGVYPRPWCGSGGMRACRPTGAVHFRPRRRGRSPDRPAGG